MVTGLICFTGCSDDFLKDKKVYGSYDASVVYENYETAKSRVDFLYQSLLPSSTGGSNALTDITSAGIASFSAVSGLFILPTYPTLVAAVQMDDTGTTRIGKLVFNHPFFIPGTIGVALSVCFGFLIGSVVL